MSNLAGSSQLQALRSAYEGGLSVRAAAVEVDVDKNTVLRWFNIWGLRGEGATDMSYLTKYLKKPTGLMMPVGMNYLSDLVIRPGIEKTFGPLLLYRGRMNRGRAHRLWNFVLLMMAAEAETIGDGLKLQNNGAFAQLCGPLKPLTKMGMWSYFGRLADNPVVTRNIEGLTDYIKMIGPDQSFLQRVDRFTDDINCAEWRTSIHPNAGQDYRERERGIAKSQQLFYPFMVHDPKKPKDGEALVLLVNRAVPNNWPEEIRADVCQELIVDVLSGSVAPGNIRDHVHRKWSEHFKILPTQYEGGSRRLAFDAPVPGTEATPWTERI